MSPEMWNALIQASPQLLAFLAVVLIFTRHLQTIAKNHAASEKRFLQAISEANEANVAQAQAIKDTATAITDHAVREERVLVALQRDAERTATLLDSLFGLLRKQEDGSG